MPAEKSSNKEEFISLSFMFWSFVTTALICLAVFTKSPELWIPLSIAILCYYMFIKHKIGIKEEGISEKGWAMLLGTIFIWLIVLTAVTSVSSETYRVLLATVGCISTVALIALVGKLYKG